MRITDVQVLLLTRIHAGEETWYTNDFRSIKADAVIVVVQTDSGLQGIGEASPYGNPTLIRDWITRLRPHLIGRDPLDPLTALGPTGRSKSYDDAVAGVDIAIWDLRGKVAGKRVADLLSDHPLDAVRLYASGGCDYDWRNHPESLIDEVLGYVANGFTACKVRIGSRWAYDRVTPDRFLGLMTELHQAVAGRLELMVDGNCRLTEDQALVVARGLDSMGFTWFEEPLDKDDLEGYVRLNAAVEMPISGGEQFTSLSQFAPYIERRAWGIAQPDVAETGISEGVRIARFAAEYGVDICPHSWHNGLMAVAHAHYVAALPNPRVLELCMHQGPLQWAILADPPVIKDGWLQLPDKPGLGVDLAPDLERHFPYVEGDYYIAVVR